MYYFNFIPNELSEIIISYLDYDDFVSLNNSFRFDLNYSQVYHYRYGTVLKLDYKGYRQYLGAEDLKNKLGLRESINELEKIEELSLYYNGLYSLPNSKVIQPKALQGPRGIIST